jgi:hypothetical protein
MECSVLSSVQAGFEAISIVFLYSIMKRVLTHPKDSPTTNYKIVLASSGSQSTHLFGEPCQVTEFPLQKRQVRPQKRDDKRAEREVGHILQRVMELFNSYVVTL